MDKIEAAMRTLGEAFQALLAQADQRGPQAFLLHEHSQYEVTKLQQNIEHLTNDIHGLLHQQVRAQRP